MRSEARNENYLLPLTTAGVLPLPILSHLLVLSKYQVTNAHFDNTGKCDRIGNGIILAVVRGLLLVLLFIK